MRILIVTDPPWVPTANAKQAAELARRLQKDLHTVYWMPSWGYREGGITKWENISVIPCDDTGGTTITKFHVRALGIELVITRGWAENYGDFGGSKFAWWAWQPGPIDRSVLRKSTHIIGASDAECKELEEISGVIPYEIPRGISTAFTRPPKDKPAFIDMFKNNHGIGSNEFVLSAIGTADPHWERMLDAFKLFHDKHEEAVLYIHTEAQSPLDLLAYCRKIRLSTDALRMPNAYDFHMGYYDDVIAAMYCVSRAHLVPGMAVQPILESLACGTPVITTDRPEAREIISINGLGALVPPKTMHQGFPLLDIDQWAEEMENCYALDARSRLDHSACCQMVVRDYHWDTVYEKFWQPQLRTFEQEEEDRATTVILPGSRDEKERGTTLIEDLGFVEEFECEVVRKTNLGGNPQDERRQNDTVKSWGPHPNIIPILRDGEDEFGRYYFDAPKLVNLRYVHDFTPQQGDKILEGIKAGLAFMHAHGAAHCDINPRNVLLTDTQKVGEIDCPICEETHDKFEMGPNMKAVVFDFDFMQAGLDPGIAWLCDYDPLDERAIDFAVPVMRTGLATRGFHRVVTHVRNLDYGHSWATSRPDVPYQTIDGVGERDCEQRWGIFGPDVKDKRVVDLGCNLGYFASRSLEEGAASVLAVDRDEAIVRNARVTHPNLDGNVRQMDLDKELPEGEFDVAFCLSVWQHLRDGKRPMLDFLKKIPVVYWEDANFTKPDLEAQGFEVERVMRSERGRNLFKLQPKEGVNG